MTCITGEANGEWISEKEKTASGTCCSAGHNHKRAMEMQHGSLKRSSEASPCGGTVDTGGGTDGARRESPG